MLSYKVIELQIADNFVIQYEEISVSTNFNQAFKLNVWLKLSINHQSKRWKNSSTKAKFNNKHFLENSGIDQSLIEKGLRQAILKAAFKEADFIDETLIGLHEDYGHLEEYEPININ